VLVKEPVAAAVLNERVKSGGFPPFRKAGKDGAPGILVKSNGRMTLTAQDRARRIKIILFDVDGVLTDGNHLDYSRSGRRARRRCSPPK
jgi:hypothetical protein